MKVLFTIISTMLLLGVVCQTYAMDRVMSQSDPLVASSMVGISNHSQEEIKALHERIITHPEFKRIFKSPYAALFPLISMEDAAKLNYILHDDLMEGTNATYKQLMFLKYVLFRGKESMYSVTDRILSRLTVFLDELNRRPSDGRLPYYLVLDERLSATRCDLKDTTKRVIQEILVTVLAIFQGVKHTVFPFEKAATEEIQRFLLFKYADSLAKANPLFCQVLKNCFEILYVNVSDDDSLLQKNIDREVRALGAHVASIPQRGFRKNYPYSPTNETYMLERFFNTFSYEELEQIVFLFVNPSFFKSISLSLLIKICITMKNDELLAASSASTLYENKRELVERLVYHLIRSKDNIEKYKDNLHKYCEYLNNALQRTVKWYNYSIDINTIPLARLNALIPFFEFFGHRLAIPAGMNGAAASSAQSPQIKRAKSAHDSPSSNDESASSSASSSQQSLSLFHSLPDPRSLSHMYNSSALSTSSPEVSSKRPLTSCSLSSSLAAAAAAVATINTMAQSAAAQSAFDQLPAAQSSAQPFRFFASKDQQALNESSRKENEQAVEDDEPLAEVTRFIQGIEGAPLFNPLIIERLKGACKRLAQNRQQEAQARQLHEAIQAEKMRSAQFLENAQLEMKRLAESHALQTQSMQTEINNLVAAREAMQLDITTLSADRQSIQAAHEQLLTSKQALQDGFNRDLAKSQQSKAELRYSLENKITQLNDLIGSMQAELTTLSVKSGQAENGLAHTKTALMKAQGDLKDAQERMQHLESDCDILQRESKDAVRTVEQLQSLCDQQAAQLKIDEERISASGKAEQLQALYDAQLAQMKIDKERILALETEVARLQQQMENDQEIITQIKSLMGSK